MVSERASMAAMSLKLTAKIVARSAKVDLGSKWSLINRSAVTSDDPWMIDPSGIVADSRRTPLPAQPAADSVDKPEFSEPA
jgi:hypothetical protein